MFYLTKAAVPRMEEGGVINQFRRPNPTAVVYATTKGAIHNFTAGLANYWPTIRIWTPMSPTTMPAKAAIAP